MIRRWALLVIFLAWPGMAFACPVIDAAEAFWPLVERSGAMTPQAQAAAFRAELVSKYPGLYADAVLDVGSAAQLDREAVRSLAKARANGLHGRDVADALQRDLSGYIAKFRAAFPDFRCDFPIYLTISLGHLDGAGRDVDGRPALVLGVDAIGESESEIPVFIAHELFHRYHFEVAGFSDDPGMHQALWRTLWAEGLATYASARLNPDHPLADAMLFPRDLAEQAAPMTARLARAFRDNGSPDPLRYAEYFEAGSERARRENIPQRSGYYIGYRVAALLARRHGLFALAHLKGARLHREIDAALDELAGR